MKSIKEGKIMKNLENNFRIILILAITVVAGFSSARADAPLEIHYQGKLTTAAGVPFTNNTYLASFRILNGATTDLTGGSIAIAGGVTTVSGVFSVLIPVPAGIIQSGTDRFLELTVDGQTFSPNMKLVAAPYAYAVAANAVSTLEVKDGSLTNSDLSTTVGEQMVGNHIAEGVIVSTHIKNGSIESGDLAGDIVAGSNILDGSLTGNDLDSEVLVSTHVKDGSLKNADLSMTVGEQMVGNHIAEGVIVSTHIKNGSLKNADLSTTVGEQMVGNHIAEGVIVSTHIKDASIDPLKITGGTFGAGDSTFPDKVGIGGVSPLSTLHVNGPIATNTHLVDSDMTLDDTDSVVFFDAEKAGTITLPEASASTVGRVITIYNIGTSSLTIEPNKKAGDAAMINNLQSISVSGRYKGVRIIGISSVAWIATALVPGS